MRKRFVGVVAGIAILAVAVLLSSGIARGQRNQPQIPGVPIGAGRIDVDVNQLTEDHWAVRAFIATGSTSPVILGTLNECNEAVNIQSFFCSPRDWNGEHGIVVSIFMHEPVSVEFGAGVTLYQQGAKHYAAPVFYAGD